MGVMASQINGVEIVDWTVCPGADKKTLKLRVTCICEGNSPVTAGFHSQRANNAENVSIWWHHHELSFLWDNPALMPQVIEGADFFLKSKWVPLKTGNQSDNNVYVMFGTAIKHDIIRIGCVTCLALLGVLHVFWYRIVFVNSLQLTWRSASIRR